MKAYWGSTGLWLAVYRYKASPASKQEVLEVPTWVLRRFAVFYLGACQNGESHEKDNVKIKNKLLHLGILGI